MKVEFNSSLGDVICTLVYKEEDKLYFFNKDLDENILLEAEDLSFKGEKDETIILKFKGLRYVLCGIKKDYFLEDLRKAYSLMYKLVEKSVVNSVSLIFPDSAVENIVAGFEGFYLASYKFDKYKFEKPEKKDIIVLLNVDSNIKTKIDECITVCNNVMFSRDLVNENSNVVVPKMLADMSLNFAKDNGLKYEILDEIQIKEKGLNLLYNVGRGSSNPPRLIIVEYNGDPESDDRYAIVGKGITFDTGGVNLKPTGFLEDMKMDMGGAACVFGAFKSIVELKLKKNVIMVISSAENSLSGSAYNPGDNLVSYKGLSVEITNTDAEGRLVLADGISYIQKNYDVTHVIDVATLTGAIMIALGTDLIGLFGNDEVIIKNLFDSGERTYERVWNLPIYDEHREMIKAKVADIKNSAGRMGGSITAAAFLEKFIEDGVKWVHLDIAGVAKVEKPKYYFSEFATGSGVRLLVDFFKR